MVQIRTANHHDGIRDGTITQLIIKERVNPIMVGDRLTLKTTGKDSVNLLGFPPIVTETIDIKMGMNDGKLWIQNQVFPSRGRSQWVAMNAQQCTQLARLQGYKDVGGLKGFYINQAPLMAVDDAPVDAPISQKFNYDDSFVFRGMVIRWRILEPFRPSNGTGGEIFYGDWCENCHYEKGKRECKVWTYGLIGQPDEWVDDVEGPVCLKFKSPTPPPAKCGKGERVMNKLARNPKFGVQTLFDWAADHTDQLSTAPNPLQALLDSVPKVDLNQGEADPDAENLITQDTTIAPHKHDWAGDADHRICRKCGTVYYCGRYERGDQFSDKSPQCDGMWLVDWYPAIAQRLDLPKPPQTLNLLDTLPGAKDTPNDAKSLDTETPAQQEKPAKKEHKRSNKKQRHKWAKVPTLNRTYCEHCGMVKINDNGGQFVRTFVHPSLDGGEQIGGMVPNCTRETPADWNQATVTVRDHCHSAKEKAIAEWERIEQEQTNKPTPNPAPDPTPQELKYEGIAGGFQVGDRVKPKSPAAYHAYELPVYVIGGKGGKVVCVPFGFPSVTYEYSPSQLFKARIDNTFRLYQEWVEGKDGWERIGRLLVSPEQQHDGIVLQLGDTPIDDQPEPDKAKLVYKFEVAVNQ